MGYVESNLLNGENVIAKAKIHRAVFISAIVILIPAIVGIINKDDRLSFIHMLWRFYSGANSWIYCFKDKRACYHKSAYNRQKGSY